MQTIDRGRSGKRQTTRKLTLSHSEWSDGWGGQERRVLSEMLGMREWGYRQLLACRSSSQIGNEAKTKGLDVAHLPFAGKFDIAPIRGLRRLIRDEDIDLISTHSGIDSWVGAIAADGRRALPRRRQQGAGQRARQAERTAKPITACRPCSARPKRSTPDCGARA